MNITLPDGRIANAYEIDVVSVSNNGPINIQLSDGTKVHMTVVIQKVFRTGMFDKMSGEPIYVVQSVNVMSVSADPRPKLESNI